MSGRLHKAIGLLYIGRHENMQGIYSARVKDLLMFGKLVENNLPKSR